MPVYNLANIREMLSTAFSIGEINTLAFDLLRQLYDDFSSGMSKSDRIEQIVMEAERNGRIPQLLNYVQEKNAYQYGRFAPHLIQEEPMPNPTTQLAGWQQRQADLKQHIETDTKLLRDFEDTLRAETHPQRRLSYEQGIERQQEALAKWRRELAKLAGEIVQDAPSDDLGHQILTEVRALQQTVTQQHGDIQSQLGGLEARLADGQQGILQRIDEQHRQTVSALVEKLDANQVELVDLLLDAHDQQQIAQWQADQLLLLTQQALVDLHRLRQGQPDAEQWQSLLTLLQKETSWEQKLKFTLPLIPSILEFESETAVDVLPALKQSWQTLVNRIRGH